MNRPEEWSVNIPLSDLNRLINHLDTQDNIVRDNEQLRKELEGLRNMFRELLDQFGELRRNQHG